MMDKSMCWKLAASAMLVVILACSSGLVVLWQTDAQSARSADVMNLRRAYENMRSGADILSLHVMRYVMMGDPVERDAYFNESKWVRHREEAIRLLSCVRGPLQVEEYIRTAMDISQELMQVEYHAMRLMVKDLADLMSAPSEIQGVRLTEEEHCVTFAERRRRAWAEIFGTEYFTFKRRIYESLDSAIEGAIQYAETGGRRALVRIAAVNILIGFSFLALGFVLRGWFPCRKELSGR